MTAAAHVEAHERLGDLERGEHTVRFWTAEDVAARLAPAIISQFVEFLVVHDRS